MRNDPTKPDPSPEQLAAYLDGELGAGERSRVEAWLADNPAAAADIDGQRRAARLWGETPPPEPGPDAWARTLTGIKARLPGPTRRRRGIRRIVWIGVGLAAAILAPLVFARLFLPAGVPPLNSQPATGPSIAKNSDPFPVIGPDDVVIISMDARDAGALVVAVPPVQQPLLVASQDDVSVMNLAPYRSDDGRVPLIGEGETPMIVAPQTPEP